MKVLVVPVLQDNLAYLLVSRVGSTAAAVDPAEPSKVIAAAATAGVDIDTVLTTHKHWDHAGGNQELARQIPEVVVVGGVAEGVPACNHPVVDGEQVRVGDITVTCIHTPYHTAGHMCYLCEEEGSEDRVLFTGDSLFIAGCGRCFAGTPAQMQQSLARLAQLPPATKVYCGHEYTVKNLEFAVVADKDNASVHHKLEWARQQRAEGFTTVPSTIAEELSYNPFLRVAEPSLMQFTGKADPFQVLAELRKRKDNFGVVSRVMTWGISLAKLVGYPRL